jgi:hypothetical protein
MTTLGQCERTPAIKTYDTQGRLMREINSTFTQDAKVITICNTTNGQVRAFFNNEKIVETPFFLHCRFGSIIGLPT